MGRRYRAFAPSAPLLGTKRREPAADRSRCTGPFEGVGDDGDQLVRQAEGREVLEGEVDRSADGAGRAQAAQFFELPFLARPPGAHERRNGGYSSVTRVKA